ncbi:MAG: hypothetical protein QW818_02420 [Candidatus Aenigmatarchaeota archaeon]
MSWRVWGNKIENSEADGTDLKYSLRFRADKNRVIRAIRTWIILYGNPSFTNLRLSIYERQGNSAGKKIATSLNSYSPLQILSTHQNGVKGIWFEFADIAIQKNEWYHLQILMNGYSFSESSHVAWVKGFPDPEYREGVSPITFEKLPIMSYRLAIIGSTL